MGCSLDWNYCHLWSSAFPKHRAPCSRHVLLFGEDATSWSGEGPWPGSAHTLCGRPPLSTGQHVCPLSRCAYILDVASEMEQVGGGYTLWFRRVLWDQPLKFENELYVTMHYNQVSTCGLLCCSGTFHAPLGEVRRHHLGI